MYVRMPCLTVGETKYPDRRNLLSFSFSPPRRDGTTPCYRGCDILWLSVGCASAPDPRLRFVPSVVSLAACVCTDAHLGRFTSFPTDVGYVLAASYWGQGVMPEAMTAVIDFARRLGLRRITATCDPDNRASIRVLEKCEFRYTDRKKAALLRPAVSDEPRDSECTN